MNAEPTCKWREQDGIIYLSVTSDGTTGPQWIERFKKKGFGLPTGGMDRNYFMEALSRLKPSSGVTTEVAILKGTLFEYSADPIARAKKIHAELNRRELDNPREEARYLSNSYEYLVAEKIRAKAHHCWLMKPNIEVACLIREKFTDEEIRAMGFSYIVTMHHPIDYFGAAPVLLQVDVGHINEKSWFNVYYGLPFLGSVHYYGFAFACSDFTHRQTQDGVIHLSVTSDGTTGPQWIERLERRGFPVEYEAANVLRSDGFKPSNGVKTEIAILQGSLFQDYLGGRTTKKICAEARRRGLTKPNAEVACLIREKFADQEIEDWDRWWIVVMHEPIKDRNGVLCLLGAGRTGAFRMGGTLTDPVRGRLSACRGVRLGTDWHRTYMFAFAVSSIAAKDSADKQAVSHD